MPNRKVLRVIFMGSGDFAEKPFEAILASNHKVVAAYTKPAKPKDRGHEVQESNIALLAKQHNIKVLTPHTLRTPQALSELQSLNPDIVVVASYGLLLPNNILSAPKYGCINIHPSSLPRWRGAAPLQHTIMSLDDKTSVCIMQMDEGLDTGDIILRQEISLDPDIVIGDLIEITTTIGSELLLQALDLIANNKVKFVKQAEHGVTYAHKITKENLRINFNETARQIEAKIRAFTTRPAMHFIYQDEIIKVIQAEVISPDAKLGEPGFILDDKLTIACTSGAIRPILLQRQGRKMIYTDAFLRGFRIPKSTKLLY